MPITGNTTLLYLCRSRIISRELYDWMKYYGVSTIDEAISFLTYKGLPESIKEELEEFKRSEAEKVAGLNIRPISILFNGGFISKHLHDYLYESGFNTIDQVIHKINSGDESFLSQTQYHRKKEFNELNYVLSIFGDAMYRENAPTEPTIAYSLKSSKDNCVENPNKINRFTTIKSLRERDLISVRTYNCLTYEKLHTIGDVIDNIKEEGSIYKLLNIRNFGKKSFIELRDLLGQVEDSSAESPMCPAEEKRIVSPIDDFILQYKELVKNNIYKLSIERYYETSKAKLSARAIHVLEQNFNSILDVACLYFEGLDIGKLKNCGKKTFDDLNTFITNLYIYISSLFTEDSQAAEKILLGNTYPFLSESEVDFVVDYKVKTSCLPMFYILYHYLIKSNSRCEKIYCRYYGLNGEPEDLGNIAESLDVSFERCRQLLAHNKIKESSLCLSKKWENYDFLDSILFYNNYDYKSFLDNEGLGHLSLFAFAGLCSLVKGIKVCKVSKVSGEKYILSKKFYNSFDLKGCIKDIESTLNKRCTEDISLPISVFIDSYWLDEPSFDVSEVENIIIYILKEDYGVEIGEDKILYIQQNAIDRSAEIYKIIEANGKPTHVEQIREALILKYPELSNLTVEQIRGDALRHYHIVPLGKSSTYAIDKWELYTGTIRDLLYDILSKEEEPMSIEELYNEVSLIYPNTNIKSITSSMVSDELQRFVRFVGSHYGVADKEYSSEYAIWDADEYSRKNFDERIEEFEAFLKSHHHLPRHNEDNEEEAALYRWYKRATASDASITLEQQEILSELLARNADYLITATEYSFYRYCEEFKVFIEDNMEFPTLETDSAKYGWFKKNLKIYKDFEDRRKGYFEDLIVFLYTYGFEI